jgi:hypothetical protein
MFATKEEEKVVIKGGRYLCIMRNDRRPAKPRYSGRGLYTINRRGLLNKLRRRLLYLVTRIF